MQTHDVLAGIADQAASQVHLGAFHLEPRACAGFGDVRCAYRAEQFALGTGFSRNRDLKALQLGAASLSRSEFFAGFLFEFGATGFEFGNVIRVATVALPFGSRKLRP